MYRKEADGNLELPMIRMTMLMNQCMLLFLLKFNSVVETQNLEAGYGNGKADGNGNNTITATLVMLENQTSPTTNSLKTEVVSIGSYSGSINLITTTTTLYDSAILIPRWFLSYEPDLSKTNLYLTRDVSYFVCGSKALCNNSVTYREALCSFECQPCQCDQSCHFYGDCCPDVLFEDSPDITSESNPYLICTEDNWTTWKESVNIFMIGKCPPNTDAIIKSKCESPDITIQAEATPVGIIESSVTYRNVFCAKCHGVIDYEIWRHEVVCSLLSSVQTATSKAHLWRIVVQDRACEIVSQPPDLISIRDCYPVEYKTCNASGKITKAPNPIVERLCHMYSHPVHYYGADPYFESYRNIFCSICDDNLILQYPLCKRIESPVIPYPLNVLLDFNPTPQRVVNLTRCELGKLFDPFTSSCQNISCPLRRSLLGNECEDIFSMASGLGIAMDFVLHPANTSLRMTGEGLTDQYRTMLNKKLEIFSPIVIHFGLIEYYTSNVTYLFYGLADHIKINLRIVSKTTRTLQELETVLFDVMKYNFTYLTEDQNITLLSDPILCPSKFKLPNQFFKIKSRTEQFVVPLTLLDQVCKIHNCNDSIIFESVQLNCSFLEYDLNKSLNFSFYSKNHSILFENEVFTLTPFRYIECGEILRVCTDELNAISRHLISQKVVPQGDLALSLVSLVCTSLSLAGLVLTFLTYSLIPKLRTLPGKNTMALVLNLFVAQLLFLTASNRTTNIVICQVLGVLIHYFWLSSFAWMFISAYHMFLVFTTLVTKPLSSGHFIKYVLICTVCPAVVVGVCLTVFLVTSDGMNSGYGGRVCFINNPRAVLGFFAVPLGLMLLLNIFFFVRTVQAIRSVPDMTTSSNQNNRQHVFVYLKLSFLFGFTWIFGLLAEILQSNALNYVFVVLTASQGLMLFVGFCLNVRTRSLLRTQLYQRNFGLSQTSFHTRSTVEVTNESLFDVGKTC